MEKNLMLSNTKFAKVKKQLTPWLFVGPAALILLVVLFVPIVNVIRYSFLSNMIMPGEHEFVWFDNYIHVLQDADFMKMIYFTIVFTLGSVLLHITFGVLLAVALNTKINKFALTFFRILFILPWVFTAAVVAVVWQLIMTPLGVGNSVLSLIFGEQILLDWLGNPSLVVISLLIINAWRGYPHCMISVLAGLQNIPTAIYEAAAVDGAGTFRKFFSITLPQLRPVLASVSLLDAIWTMNLFPLIWLTTGGGPSGMTESIATMTYRFAFVEYQFGYSSALAVIGLILTMGVTVFYIKAQKNVT